MTKSNANFDASIATIGCIPGPDPEDVKLEKIKVLKSFYFKSGQYSLDNIDNITDVRKSTDRIGNYDLYE